MSDQSGNESRTERPKRDRFDHYWEYAKLWRTWVVGIAAGALFILLSKDVGGAFESRARVATLFIVAAGGQVLVAWINKTAAYYEYRDECNRRDRKISRKWVLFWCWVGGCYWIDFILDFVSLGLVALAVVMMIQSLLS